MMNCTGCNYPLEPQARFCRNCGLPVSPASPATPIPASSEVAQGNRQGVGDSPVVVSPPWLSQQQAPLQSRYDPQAYQPTMAVSPNRGSMASAEARYASPSRAVPTGRRKNRLTRVLLILLVVLLVIVLLLAGGWFFLLRPYLHNTAQNEVDTIFLSTTNMINPLALAVIAASHRPVIITQSDANTFIAMNSSQSDPVQQPHLTITPSGLQLTFQTYGLTSTITAVPHLVNGQIVMTNVTVQGPASLIMSPDELTTETNSDLQQVSAALHRPIAKLVLKSQEIDVQLA